MKYKTYSVPPTFIEAELGKIGLETHKTSNNIMIPCPFHKETHPSLSVSLGGNFVAGGWHCLGCHESGSWNKLAKRLGLRLWGKEESEQSNYVITTKAQVKDELKEDKLKLSKWTDEYKWKRFNASFLKKFGARLLYDFMYKAHFLYLPITYLNEQYGYCKVRLSDDVVAPKYWFNAKLNKVLFPIDYIIQDVVTDCVVLVEGMADALRLLKYNIPALALLGVVLTPFMEEQLENLAVKNIILCLDSDDPGRNAVFGYVTESGKEIEGLASKLESLGYNVYLLLLPKPEDGTDKYDPDNMPIKYVRCLGKMVRRLGGPKCTV